MSVVRTVAVMIHVMMITYSAVQTAVDIPAWLDRQLPLFALLLQDSSMEPSEPLFPNVRGTVLSLKCSAGVQPDTVGVWRLLAADQLARE